MSDAVLVAPPGGASPSALHTRAVASRRMDIDLLRALAVLAVILFHFDVSGLGGGFLGVDVFFVISGYLITLHIRQQLSDGSFSFVNFYARRIRRLFPALAATLVLTGIAAVYLFPDRLLKEFSQSAIASSVYVSNIYFWSIADYFDTESVYKPLLHTWSLSVEEQFYIFWPLVVLVFSRRHLNIAIAIAGTLSVLAGMFLDLSAATVFYHFPFRVHEFALGALISGFSISRMPRWAGAIVVLAAFAAILFGLVTTTEQSRFPGLGSAAVVLGTTLIIAVQHPWFNTSWWAFWPIRRIGLTSYSAYLVHWPLVVFYKLAHPGTLTPAAIAMLLGVTFVLAEIFYTLIERPTALVKLPRFRFAIIAFAPVMLMGAIGFNIYIQKFRNVPMESAEAPIETNQYTVQQLLDNIPDRRDVLLQAENEIKERATGTVVPNRKVIAVLGDSHAVDMSLTLRLALGDDNAEVVLIHSICDPLTINSVDISMQELYKTHSQDKTREEGYCYPQHADLLGKIKAAKPDLIVFSEAWRADALPFLTKTIEEIGQSSSAKVLVLGRVVQFGGAPDVIFRDAVDVEQMNKSAWSKRYAAFEDFDSILAGIAKDTGAYFISKTDLICPDRVCDVGIGPELGYVDAQHWSLAGMKLYGSRLIADPVFQQAIMP